MRLITINILCSVLLLSCNAPVKSVKHIDDNSSSWYYPDWAANAPYAPTFEMLDTESSLGPYAKQTKTITLKDLVKMHGHLCDGLVTASCALELGLDRLYPDGVIDRTDTCCISNNSPCFGDTAAYLTGGRIRFGTQKIDPNLSNELIIYRMSTKQAVKISLKEGVFPPELAELEKKIKSGDFTIEQMRLCQKLGWDFAESLINKSLGESFVVEDIDDLVWKSDNYIYQGKRSDIINKNIK
ncbi:MAG: formylmethanofuran dehydrogenase subunit E family protein [Sedimentisphaerales bacterium]|nr:formylmethanofuran dehydrogenase subunit E family protein [Sedimentisphaerales bacterium]